MKVKASREIFDQWRVLGQRITELATIIQNDREIEFSDITEWSYRANGITYDIVKQIDLTVKHLIRDA